MLKDTMVGHYEQASDRVIVVFGRDHPAVRVKWDTRFL